MANTEAQDGRSQSKLPDVTLSIKLIEAELTDRVWVPLPRVDLNAMASTDFEFNFDDSVHADC